MTTEELKIVLENHEKWLVDDPNGVRAALIRMDLRGVDLSGADLATADLSFTDLHCANLSGADLSSAILTGANLSFSNLSNADLSYANLTSADLRSADLSFSDLVGARMRMTTLDGSKLNGADLYNADMIGTNLHYVDVSKVKRMPFIPYICPDFGSFTGWKVAMGVMIIRGVFNKYHTEKVIVELEIPEAARRSSGAGRQCRCDKAKVVSISALDGSAIECNEAYSWHDPHFIYRIGEIVSVPNFDENRWAVGSAGIHFFINRQEAVEYAT